MNKCSTPSTVSYIFSAQAHVWMHDVALPLFPLIGCLKWQTYCMCVCICLCAALLLKGRGSEPQKVIGWWRESQHQHILNPVPFFLLLTLAPLRANRAWQPPNTFSFCTPLSSAPSFCTNISPHCAPPLCKCERMRLVWTWGYKIIGLSIFWRQALLLKGDRAFNAWALRGHIWRYNTKGNCVRSMSRVVR